MILAILAAPCSLQPKAIRLSRRASSRIIRSIKLDTRGCNLVHGSDSPESASYEIGLYFNTEEIVKFDFSDANWLYASND